MKRLTQLFVGLLLAALLTACEGGGGGGLTLAESSSKAITSFSLAGVAGTINETNNSIAVTVPFGTNVTALAATFTTTGVSVKVGTSTQTSGVTVNDFSSPVNYKVSAADGTTANYTVVVTVALNSAKEITAFSLAGTAGTISEANKTIDITVPYGTAVTAQVATFTTTGTGVTVGSIAQTSGTTPNDFTNPVSYTVTAADGTTAIYTVTVFVAPSPAKAITAYSLEGAAGVIDEAGKTIAVTMPSGTNVTALTATFTTNGASVKVGATLQTSGTTQNDFTSPVIYTVTAADGTSVNYTVTVSVPACPTGQSVCSGSCVNLTTDVDNCGACASVCTVTNATPGCTSGLCGIASCNQGFADCDHNIADGCETSISTDVNNCGACGNVCASRICQNGTCQQPTCSDGVKNGDETAIDCGGSCTKCSDGNACSVSSDCLSGFCQSGICQAPSCSDGVKNGLETDIDCGGGSCQPCPSGFACLVSSDCQSLSFCQNGVCQLLYASGSSCSASNECLSAICQNGICQ